jgi:hypothetical protein
MANDHPAIVKMLGQPVIGALLHYVLCLSMNLYSLMNVLGWQAITKQILCSRTRNHRLREKPLCPKTVRMQASKRSSNFWIREICNHCMLCACFKFSPTI